MLDLKVRKEGLLVSTSHDILPVTHISEALTDSYKYIKGRKDGTITVFKTKFERLNKLLNGGLEDNTILAISALSGGGKSALSQVIRQSLIDLNPSRKMVQTVMNFEMIARSVASRSAVTGCDISLSKLYSVEEPLSDSDLYRIKNYYESISRQDTFFIDVAGTPKQIADSIYSYWEKYCAPTDKTLLYEIDHMKLIKKTNGQSDVDLLDEMMVRLVDVKKKISKYKGSSIGMVLSQMNREIKKDARVLNKEMHKPDSSCLFGSSSIEFGADFIIIAHMPAKLGIQSYTNQDLPTWYKYKENEYMLPYFELVKNRSGAPDRTIPMLNYLSRFNFEEMKIDSFNDLTRQFHESNKQIKPILNKFK